MSGLELECPDLEVRFMRTKFGKIQKNGNYLEVIIDHELILMNTDNGRFYSLQDTGRRIWELLSDHKDLEKILKLLRGEYELNEQALMDDIYDLIDEI
jgi:hypothetical protein